MKIYSYRIPDMEESEHVVRYVEELKLIDTFLEFHIFDSCYCFGFFITQIDGMHIGVDSGDDVFLSFKKLNEKQKIKLSKYFDSVNEF